jgi:hypothetical protein
LVHLEIDLFGVGAVAEMVIRSAFTEALERIKAATARTARLFRMITVPGISFSRYEDWGLHPCIEPTLRPPPE